MYCSRLILPACYVRQAPEKKERDAVKPQDTSVSEDPMQKTRDTQTEEALALQRRPSTAPLHSAESYPKQDGHIGESSNAIMRKSKRKRRKRRSSWWYRAFTAQPLQWGEWEISQLPRSIKPVLVFINVRSGPQIGDAVRVKLLRILHPLQVVSLPRDPPDPALRLFAHVPGLRILCIGGDGTVGWYVVVFWILLFLSFPCGT